MKNVIEELYQTFSCLYLD